MPAVVETLICTKLSKSSQDFLYIDFHFNVMHFHTIKYYLRALEIGENIQKNSPVTLNVK